MAICLLCFFVVFQAVFIDVQAAVTFFFAVQFRTKNLHDSACDPW